MHDVLRMMGSIQRDQVEQLLSLDEHSILNNTVHTDGYSYQFIPRIGGRVLSYIYISVELISSI
jgi:hypothetical protein